MIPRMNSEAIEEVAARWFARRMAGAWTDADQAQLDAWLNEATEHRIAFVRLQTAWKQAARMKALGAGVPPGAIPARASWADAPFFGRRQSSAPTAPPSTMDLLHTKESREPRRRRFGGKYLAIAATLLLASVMSLYFYSTQWSIPRYSTGVGGLDIVPLEDGSQVMLNTNSRIRVALTETERRIELDKGEAFFEVAKDRQRPFVVLAGDRRVVAVGTKFSVRRHDNGVEVIVTEGRVRLESSDNSPAQPATQLDAGAIARTANSAVMVKAQSPADVEQFLSWRSGYLRFRDTALADAVAEFNRYSKRKIIIADASISSIRIGGNFRTDSEEAFLWLLQNGFPVVVEQAEEQVVLKAR
jgi:transmembrane sensor